MSACIEHGGKGYAQRGAAKKYLHRLVWEEHHGPIPDGHVIHHRCENQACINVEHMEAMTQADHIRLHRPRGVRRRQTVCKRCGGTDFRQEKNCARCRPCERRRKQGTTLA